MQTVEVSVRPATLDDLPALVEIEKRVHVAPWTLEHFQAELEKPYSRVLLLTDDDTDSEIRSYIVCWLMAGDCQILNVAVDLPFRGLGYAQKQVRTVLNLATQAGLKRAVLEVRKSNLAAISLYQKQGFVISQVRKAFYSNGEDAYFMTLALEEDGIRF